MRPGRTPLDVTQEPLKVQLETFLDEHRAALHACLDGLTEEQARRSLVPSRTTLLGLVKHATYAERVWFGEAVTGRPRQEMGLPPTAAEAFILNEEDSIESVRRAHAQACEASRRAAAPLGLDDVLRGHYFGPLPLRWVYLHALREFATWQPRWGRARPASPASRSGVPAAARWLARQYPEPCVHPAIDAATTKP